MAGVISDARPEMPITTPTFESAPRRRLIDAHAYISALDQVTIL